MYQKFKSLAADDLTFTVILLVLVAGLAFGLGRLSVGGVIDREEGVTLNGEVRVKLVASSSLPAALVQATSSIVGTTEPVLVLPKETNYVASKSGTKYHHRSCPGAKQIKAENKIWFSTALEAQAAGYTKAANCKVE